MIFLFRVVEDRKVYRDPRENKYVCLLYYVFVFIFHFYSLHTIACCTSVLLLLLLLLRVAFLFLKSMFPVLLDKGRPCGNFYQSLLSDHYCSRHFCLSALSCCNTVLNNTILFLFRENKEYQGVMVLQEKMVLL